MSSTTSRIFPAFVNILWTYYDQRKVGNLIALAGSFFLKGPRTQWRQMWHESRMHATGLYIGSLFLTLFVAFIGMPGPKGLYLVLLMICQYLVRTEYLPTVHYIMRCQPFVLNLVAYIEFVLFLLLITSLPQHCVKFHPVVKSITWYCLSYIPFAREAITSYVRRNFVDE